MSTFFNIALFVAVAVVSLLVCGATRRYRTKRRKPPPASVLLPLISRRPLPCRLCPVHGVCNNMHNQ